MASGSNCDIDATLRSSSLYGAIARFTINYTVYPVSSCSLPNEVVQLRTTINAFVARETFPPAATASDSPLVSSSVSPAIKV